MTDRQGRFSVDDLPTDRALTVTAANDVNIANGISSLDIVLITRHILGIQSFTNPFQFIASDVNNNGSVSAVDLVGIRRVLLGLSADFDGRPSWIYVPENADLSESAMRNGVQTSITIPATDADAVDLNFIGVKIGDIDVSAAIE
jgi:hypothetical protein